MSKVRSVIDPMCLMGTYVYDDKGTFCGVVVSIHEEKDGLLLFTTDTNNVFTEYDFILQQAIAHPADDLGFMLDLEDVEFATLGDMAAPAAPAVCPFHIGQRVYGKVNPKASAESFFGTVVEITNDSRGMFQAWTDHSSLVDADELGVTAYIGRARKTYA